VSRLRILLTRRWLGYLAFAVAFAIACAFLSSWQLARGKEAVAANALITANFDSTPVSLEFALPDRDAFRADQQWSRVKATGQYLPDEQLLVRNRPTNDGPGFEVLTPLKLADGSLFIVDRGWVPTGNRQDAPDSVPAPPRGEVTVIVRLQPSEARLDTRGATGRQIATINLPEVAAAVRGKMYIAAYGVLDTQSPTGAALTPVNASAPILDEGLHWSYMIQWVIFALIGFFGLGYAVRQEHRLRNADDPVERAKAEDRERKRALKKTDADVEDEILDGARN
jgi:cytochrome oxidase assembly protein ShyY1